MPSDVAGTTAAPAKKKRGLMGYLGLLAVAGVLGAVLFTALRIEDWSRDLSQNSAETSPLADHELMRPAIISLAPDETVKLIRSTLAELWGWEETPAGGEAAGGDEITMNLVHTTTFLRFKDDVTVIVSPGADGSVVRVASKSRIGKGDLGQNPRNIKQLLYAVLLRAPAQDRSRIGGGKIFQ